MSAGCGGCDRKWTGLAECHCSGCHRHFGSISAFDTHQGADGCHDPAALKPRKNGAPRLVSVKRASGTVWVAPGGDWREAS